MGCYRAKHTHDMDESARGFSDSHTSSHISRRGSQVPVQWGHLWTGPHTWAPQGHMRGSRRPPVGAPAGQLHARQSSEAGSLRGAEPSVGPMAISLRGYSRPEKGETWQRGRTHAWFLCFAHRSKAIRCYSSPISLTENQLNPAPTSKHRGPLSRA